MKKVIFFDRDGTLIVDKVYLNNPDEIIYLPGVFSALKRLRDENYQFVVVTNQSGVVRGLVTPKNLVEIHRRIRFAFAEQGIDFLDFYFAPYHTNHDHLYRKPNPGMLLQAAQEHKIDLAASWMIGDKMTDVEAGHRAGTRTILVNSKENIAEAGYAPPLAVVGTITEVADFIVAHDVQGTAQGEAL